MPVFDFNDNTYKKQPAQCTYQIFYCKEEHPTAEHPILLLDNKKKEWNHHSVGVFTNPA